MTQDASTARRPFDIAATLRLLGMLAVVVGVTVTLVWAAAGGGYFWPVWVWFPLVAVGAGGLLASRVIEVDASRRPLTAHVAAAGWIEGVLVAVWLLTSRGVFWPIWPALALGAVLTVHAVLVRFVPGPRERELSVRVEQLSRSSRQTIDVQTNELRRIERDLHDGAQARLVAVSMALGQAELALTVHPAAEDLTAISESVVAAHRHADLAIAELRDLARGIAPPILADRGLAAAVEALANRSAVPVAVSAQVIGRPCPTVERAAYFVVGEALTNVAKHAGSAAAPASATVFLCGDGAVLRVTVADDGFGGADPAGDGLAGLAARVTGLDGSVWVSDGPTGGTVLCAQLGYGG